MMYLFMAFEEGCEFGLTYYVTDIYTRTQYAAIRTKGNFSLGVQPKKFFLDTKCTHTQMKIYKIKSNVFTHCGI